MLNLVFGGDPVPKGRPRFTRGGIVYTPSKTRAYEKQIASLAKAQIVGHQPLNGPLRVDVVAYLHLPVSMSKKERLKALAFKTFPTKKPDIDNLVKAALDALNGIVWHDDSQICQLSMQKVYSLNPRLTVCVGSIG